MPSAGWSQVYTLLVGLPVASDFTVSVLFLLQNKFISLSLAFKTDKLTLSNRLELQQRQRDTAERNIDNEIQALKSAVGVSFKRFYYLATFWAFWVIF